MARSVPTPSGRGAGLRSHALYRRFGKRLLDLALALPAALALSPLALAVALAIRVRLGKPVLFRQSRPGLDEEPFELIKFRSMHDEPGPRGQELPDEHRLTPLGRFLRRTSLDEIPELWNVLRGEMSLVGPRPLLMEYLDRYRPEHRLRHRVRPGITGWAQVHGRNELDWERRFELDRWYVEHLGPGLDLRILWRTVAAVVRGEGISAAGHATMPRFGEDRRD